MFKLLVSTQVALAQVGRDLQNRRTRRRAAGMLEYALVALVSIAVFLVIRTVFPDLVKDIFEKMAATVKFQN